LPLKATIGFLRASNKQIEHSLGIGTAIDVVAEVDLDTMIARASRCYVLVDKALDALQKVRTSVHIANGIKNRSIWSGWM
jgi:hypothetical protein